MLNKRVLFVLVFIVSFLINVVGIDQQGETWDEIAYYNAAKQYYRNLYHLDFKADSWIANKEHPAMGKWVLGIGSLQSFKKGEVNYSGGRFVSAILSATTVGLTALIAVTITRSLISGAMAGLLTASYPLFVGLSKVYGLDIPTAFFFTLSVYLLALGLKTKKEKYFWLCSVTTALTVATRLIGLLLFPLIFIATIIFIKDFIAKEKKQLLSLAKYLLIFPIVSLIIFIVSYPWFWNDTIAHINKMIAHWGSVDEILFGKIGKPDKLYFIYYLLAVTPTLTLIGLTYSLISLFKKPSRWSWFILTWFLVPFIWSFSYLKQDGLRYLIMIVPALAVLISYAWFRMNVKYRLISNLAILIIIGAQVVGLFVIHPYYLDYYNALVGGPKKVYASRNYQFSWWGEGLYKAGEWLNTNVANESTVSLKALPDHAVGKLKPGLEIIKDQPIEPDYIVENAGYSWYKSYHVPENYSLVFQENAGGAPLVTVWKKK